MVARVAGYFIANFTKRLVAVAMFFVLAFSSALQADEFESFESSVAPIFREHCLQCHNSSDKYGEFSLESKSEFLSFDSSTSDLSIHERILELVTPVAGEAQMPQDAKHLSNSEIQLIREWVERGAVWPREFKLTPTQIRDFDWWSYKPFVQPKPPPSSQWCQTPIDNFIVNKLTKEKLQPSPEADRRSLIRRVTYDLVGLPPTPEEVEAFVMDSRPDAYERLVDRLLLSPQYGERWARHWLDIVKYADTCGYDKDKLRMNAWPYRDYVVRSFNDDKPYDQFAREQIAGDALYPGAADGILGLGFIAAGPWDHIGHVEVPESKLDGQVARHLDRDDMVSNTMNTFASVTVQCARCHNHKFDPITQEHYYGLQAVFSAVDRAERVYGLDPSIAKRKHELQKELKQNKQVIEQIDALAKSLGGEKLNAFNKTISALEPELKIPAAFGFHSSIASQANEEKWVELRAAQEHDLARVEIYPCHDTFAGIGAGFGFPIRFRVEAFEGQAWNPILDHTSSDFANPGLAPVIVNTGVSTARIRLTATKLAERKGDFHLALSEIRLIDQHGANVSQECEVIAKDSIESPVRWQRINLIDNKWPRHPDDARQDELLKTYRAKSTLMSQLVPPIQIQRKQDAKAAIANAERELQALPQGKLVYAATSDFRPQGNFKPTLGTMRTVHVLHRGNLSTPSHEAIPGTIPLSRKDTWLFPKSESESANRTELAMWLTAKKNPLFWRSIANRVWQYHFAQGIVDTPNDFGRMGSLPSHPNLLDWLAAEIRDSKSLKHMHRMIVCSAVYRQQSAERADAAAVDQGNRLLWRMPRRRLEAEEIRDSVLAVSGALRADMGGPGFFLFKLEKTTHSPHYEYHKFDPADEDSHRRSVYRFIVRSQPDPWMTALDCADSSQSTPKRSETLTPIQSLALLNNAFNLEMSARFARRLENETNEVAKQIERALELCLQRPA